MELGMLILTGESWEWGRDLMLGLRDGWLEREGLFFFSCLKREVRGWERVSCGVDSKVKRLTGRCGHRVCGVPALPPLFTKLVDHSSRRSSLGAELSQLGPGPVGLRAVFEVMLKGLAPATFGFFGERLRFILGLDLIGPLRVHRCRHRSRHR